MEKGGEGLLKLLLVALVAMGHGNDAEEGRRHRKRTAEGRVEEERKEAG